MDPRVAVLLVRAREEKSKYAKVVWRWFPSPRDGYADRTEPRVAGPKHCPDVDTSWGEAYSAIIMQEAVVP